ncbi:hypothetical protein JW977_03275 [Candidatus Falkowbacteria bacterium]|nr:hypothetical protein [Candidatus Falkowbacteria bacterium]
MNNPVKEAKNLQTITWFGYLFGGGGVLLVIVLFLFAVIGNGEKNNQQQKENLSLTTRIIHEGTGTIVGQPEIIDRNSSVQVIKVIVGNGMFPVLTNVTDPSYRYLVPGRQVKFKCVFYGYSNNIGREACMIVSP